MPFIPHTQSDVRSMLGAIGVDSIEALFDEIPKDLRAGELKHVPSGRTEMEMLQLLAERAKQDETGPCFLGAGSYDHHIPAAVWDVVQRGEFMTAYTPYQAEASQGTLQLIYEYQSMITALTGMDVSNASVYDGGSGLAEAVLMAVRVQKKAPTRRVLAADTVHPLHRRAAHDIVKNQRIEIDALPMGADGRIDVQALERESEPPVAIVLQQPNFFGLLEDVDALCNWAAARNVLVIAVVSPLSLALLKPPSEWGEKGADIVVGDGQPFGIPMASGGPSFGFMCCREALVRQMPGRIIGRTVDLDGKPGFTLTLQAREQHIRRAKATSNICTNQGLLVTAATVHMSILGAEGLKRVAIACHENTKALAKALCSVKGVSEKFGGPFFHERVMQLPKDARNVVDALAKEGIVGGIALGDDYPALANCLVVCATEKRTAADIERYRSALAEVLA
jgi:glycine cleavage system P protein (glycine dehydrogenase) subunit 1